MDGQINRCIYIYLAFRDILAIWQAHIYEGAYQSNFTRKTSRHCLNCISKLLEMLSSGYRKRQVRLGCLQGTPAAILGLIMLVPFQCHSWPMTSVTGYHSLITQHQGLGLQFRARGDCSWSQSIHLSVDVKGGLTGPSAAGADVGLRATRPHSPRFTDTGNPARAYLSCRSFPPWSPTYTLTPLWWSVT